MSDKKRKITESLESILDEKKCNDVIKNSMKHDFISKSNFFMSLTILMIISPIIKKIGFSHDTILKFIDIVEISKDLSVNLFGILFTGYALFQAFTNGELIEKMLSNTGKEKSIFQEYNLFFFKTSILYLLIIVINYVLLIILKNIPEHFFVLLFSNETNNIIATMLIAVYLFINIYSILEIKSLLYNIYQAFNMNALNEGIKSLNEDK